jgi:glucosyl-3-phosphoglycerate phosphatase
MMTTPESFNNDVPGKPARLLLVRHGESTWNARGLWQGQADPPLSERGEAQARMAAEALAGLGIERVISSDLARASKTGHIIADHLGLGRVILDPGFREVDVGEWSGLTRLEIERGWPGLRAAWAENKLDSTPGGEPLTSFTARVVASTARASETARDGSALVIGHSRVISALERFVGAQPGRAGHLSGRWFEVDSSGRIRGRQPVDLLGEIKEPMRS